jgi:hypothetical protein
LEPLQQLKEEAFGRLFVATASNQNIQHHAILIDRSPEVVGLAADLDIDFIQMPFVSRLPSLFAQFLSVFLTKLQTPLANRFIADDNAARSHHQLHIAKADGKLEVEPNTLLNDLDGKTIPFISWVLNSGTYFQIMAQKPG